MPKDREHCFHTQNLDTAQTHLGDRQTKWRNPLASPYNSYDIENTRLLCTVSELTIICLLQLLRPTKRLNYQAKQIDTVMPIWEGQKKWQLEGIPVTRVIHLSLRHWSVILFLCVISPSFHIRSFNILYVFYRYVFCINVNNKKYWFKTDNNTLFIFIVSICFFLMKFVLIKKFG